MKWTVKHIKNWCFKTGIHGWCWYSRFYPPKGNSTGFAKLGSYLTFSNANPKTLTHWDLYLGLYFASVAKFWAWVATSGNSLHPQIPTFHKSIPVKSNNLRNNGLRPVEKEIVSWEIKDRVCSGPGTTGDRDSNGECITIMGSGPSEVAFLMGKRRNKSKRGPDLRA